MGTLTVTTAGFSALPASAPPGWPNGVGYPGGVPNGTKSLTINDADMLAILSWVASTMTTNTPPLNPTLAQILVQWVTITIDQITTTAVQQYHVTPPVIPPPISIS